MLTEKELEEILEEELERAYLVAPELREDSVEDREDLGLQFKAINLREGINRAFHNYLTEKAYKIALHEGRTTVIEQDVIKAYQTLMQGRPYNL